MQNKNYYKKDNAAYEKKETLNEVVDNHQEIATDLNRKAEFKVGAVSDCTQLNIRREPRSDSEVICVIGFQSKVMISEKESTEVWLKVCTEAGAEGFCMKKYIRIQ